MDEITWEEPFRSEGTSCFRLATEQLPDWKLPLDPDGVGRATVDRSTADPAPVGPCSGGTGCLSQGTTG